MILFLDLAVCSVILLCGHNPYKIVRKIHEKERSLFLCWDSRFVSFSTQQVKADEQHASDQTPENTSAVVATTTSSEAQNTVSGGVGVEKVFRQKIPLQQRQHPSHTDS